MPDSGRVLVVLVLVGGILWVLRWALHRPDITVIECLGAALVDGRHAACPADCLPVPAERGRPAPPTPIAGGAQLLPARIAQALTEARRCLASLSTRLRARTRRGSLVQGERHRRDRLHFIRLFGRRRPVTPPCTAHRRGPAAAAERSVAAARREAGSAPSARSRRACRRLRPAEARRAVVAAPAVAVAVVVAALAAVVAVAGSTSDSHALLASGAVGGTSNLLQVLHPAPMALAH